MTAKQLTCLRLCPMALEGKSKVKLSLNCHTGAKGERSFSSYSFLTSAEDGVSDERHAPAAPYYHKRTPGTHWIGGWVGLRAGLERG
jgi:hypothetical protein